MKVIVEIKREDRCPCGQFGKPGLAPFAKALAVLLSRKALAAVLDAFDPQPQCYWPMKVIVKSNAKIVALRAILGNRGYAPFG